MKIENGYHYPADENCKYKGFLPVLQFRIPVEIVSPAFVQEVGRIGAAIQLQLDGGGLQWLADREHFAFLGQVIALQEVAVLAGGADVFPGGGAAAGFRDNVVEGQFMGAVFGPAILAGPAVAQENVKPRKGGPRLGLHIFLQRNDAGDLHLKTGGTNNSIVFGYDADTVEEHSLDSFLPRPERKGKIT